jgi:hypothetical protein
MPIPAEMYDPDIPERDDWIGWKPAPSTVTETDLDELEGMLGTAYPPPYRTFLRYLHFYDLTERGVRFFRHPFGTWREKLTQMYNAIEPKDHYIGAGFIPFGNEDMMDAGPVCFDTRNRRPDGDCPVVFLDHEWFDTEKELRPMFSSSLKMFECLTIVAESEIDFVYHDEDDPPEQVAEKKRLMARFLRTDPEGAGGPAQDYWTRWGVNPGMG